MYTKRWNPSRTPPSWGWAAALVALWWLSFLVGDVVENQLRDQVHRLSLDAVVGNWILMSVLVVPVVGGATVAILRRYPGSVSLWHWDAARPGWSIVWTLGTAWVAYASFALFHSFTPCDWLNQMLWGGFLYVLLVLRAVLVARRH